jgi:multiple sugar transport system ATP-binding protein
MASLSLRLEHLERRFRSIRAVDDLSLEVPEGAFLTLLGPSGCGKSTTLALVAGLDRPNAGKIYLGDTDITDVPPNERRMAMVFQNYALYPHMNAFDNMAFGLRLQRRPGAEIKERVAEMARMLGVEHLLRRKPGELSGGQQQRVALGRAMIKEPLVFLLDEPFSNLDAGLRSRMRSDVKRIHMRLGTTSLFVTHDQEEALSLSDIIAVMRDGKVVQVGTQHEIYRTPINTYVATFVGKPRMSLLDGRLTSNDDAICFEAPGINVELGSSTALGLKNGDWGAVHLGVRAEDVKVSSTADDIRHLEATVQLLEPVGSDIFVELGVGATTVIARVDPDMALGIGQKVFVGLGAGHIHLFSGEQGDRINK